MSDINVNAYDLYGFLLHNNRLRKKIQVFSNGLLVISPLSDHFAPGALSCMVCSLNHVYQCAPAMLSSSHMRTVAVSTLPSQFFSTGHPYVTYFNASQPEILSTSTK